MRKKIIMLLIATLTILSLSSCGHSTQSTETTESQDKTASPITPSNITIPDRFIAEKVNISNWSNLTSTLGSDFCIITDTKTGKQYLYIWSYAYEKGGASIVEIGTVDDIDENETEN